MDPLSIAASATALATAAIAISKTLYSWIDNTSKIDITVDDLRKEVLSLSTVLKAVSNGCEELRQIDASAFDRDRESWSCVRTHLDSCKSTIRKLKLVLEGVERGETHTRGLFRRPVKQLSLSVRAEEIKLCRQQIRNHNRAMQLPLQMINISISLQTRKGQKDTDRKIVKLGKQIEHMEDGIDRLRDLQITPSDLRTENTNLYRNMRNLAHQARAFSANASSVSGTVYGGSVNGDPLSHDQYESIEDWIPPPVPPQQQQDASDKLSPLMHEEAHPSTIEQLLPLNEVDSPWSSSEVLSPLGSKNTSTPMELETYTAPAIVNPLTVSKARLSISDALQFTFADVKPPPGRDVLTHPGQSLKSASKRVISSPHNITALDTSSQSDSDSGIEREAMEKIKDLAFDSFQTQDHPRTERLIGQAIIAFNQREGKKRASGIEVRNLEIWLAMVYCLQDKWKEAEDLLLAVTTSDVETKIELYHGLHALALKNMIDGNFSIATKYCTQAICGKKQVLGRDNRSVEESIFLLAKIHEFGGNLTRAERYRYILKDSLPDLIITVPTHPLRYIQMSYGLSPSTPADEQEFLRRERTSRSSLKSTRCSRILSNEGLAPLVIGINLGLDTTSVAVGMIRADQGEQPADVMFRWPGWGDEPLAAIWSIVSYNRHQKVSRLGDGDPHAADLTDNTGNHYRLATLLTCESFNELKRPPHKPVIDILGDYFTGIQQAARDYLCEQLGDRFYRSFPDIKYILAVPAAYVLANSTHAATIRSAWTRSEFDDRLTLVDTQEAVCRQYYESITFSEETVIMVINAGYYWTEVSTLKIYAPFWIERSDYRAINFGYHVLDISYASLLSEKLSKRKFASSGSKLTDLHASHMNAFLCLCSSWGGTYQPSMDTQADMTASNFNEGYNSKGLELSTQELFAYFDSTFREFQSTVRKLLDEARCPPSHVILSGGLGHANYLFACVRHCLSKANIKAKILRAGSAAGGIEDVVRGAVLAGTERSARATSEADHPLE